MFTVYCIIQDHIINKPDIVLCGSHMHITVLVTGLGMNPPPVVPTASIFESVPAVMHLKVTYTTPPHPPLLLQDKLRCCNPLGDLIPPLELWPRAEGAGGAGECPEITWRD